VVTAAITELPFLLQALLLTLLLLLYGVFLQKSTVAITAFANTTAIVTTVAAIVRLPSLLLAAVTFVRQIIAEKKNLSP
jgi:hypothetical protein